MKQYHEHLEAILKYGSPKGEAREGMPRTLSLFGHQSRYDLQKGFPLLTTKKVNFKHIVVELLWFLKGDTNIKYLVDNGVNIWNEDAYNYYLKFCRENGPGFSTPPDSFEEFIKGVKKEKFIYDFKYGDTGKQYPWLWRNWDKGNSFEMNGEYHESEKIDQVKDLIEGLKYNPMSRRHIITAWNPATVDDMALPACHSFVQFNVREIPLSTIQTKLWLDNGIDIPISKMQDYINNHPEVPRYYLDCQLYQRSADMFLGVPYNIASYALLTHIIAKITGMEPGHFIHSFGDSHIYGNHMEQVKELLERDPEKYSLPKLKINRTDLSDFYMEYFENPNPDDFVLEGYESYPAIKGKLSTGLK